MEESRLDRANLRSMKFIANFSIFFGLVFLIMQFLFFSKMLSVVGLIPIIIGYYFSRRIVRVNAIGEYGVTFRLGKKEVHLLKDNIISVAKAVRFTATEKFWLILTFYDKDKKKKGHYFFVNEPGSNFLELFKSMGVKLMNLP
jgi:hypothetical protein